LGWHSHDIYIGNNTIFDNRIQFQTINKNLFPSNYVLKDNIFFSKTPASKTMSIDGSYGGDLTSIGLFDGNYYAKPRGDEGVVNTEYYIDTRFFTEVFTLDKWMADYDHNLKKVPSNIGLPYIVNSLTGSNKLTNGTFSSDISGISLTYTGTGALSWDNTGKLDGGCLKLAYTTLSTQDSSATVLADVGPVTAGKKYILRFSILGTRVNKAVLVNLRQGASPWGALTFIQSKSLTTSRKEHEILIEPTMSDSNARLYFTFIDTDGTVYMDNMQFQEANVTKSPESNIRFEFNDTGVAKTVVLDSTYTTVDGKQYTGSITLQPYTSVILMKVVN
jgi:hypothetical protein